jgi:uncharacterized protein YggU (UPF0235/DUF167 family)
MAATLKTRIEAHIAVQRKRATEMLAEADALEAAVHEQPTDGQLAKQLLDWFVAEWQKRHRGETYVVNGAKDMASLKRLLKQLSAREIAERMKLYLDSRDKFYVDARWSLALFCGSINKFMPKSEGAYALSSAAVGCKHDPRCSSDAAHTARVVREAKAV